MFFYTFLPKLLNMSLTGGVVILAVLLLRIFLDKRPKILIYSLWGIVLFRLLCPITIPSPISLFGLFNTPVTESSERINRIEYIPDDIVYAEEPAVLLPIPQLNPMINDILLHRPVAIATGIWLLGFGIMGIYAVISYQKLKKSCSLYHLYKIISIWQMKSPPLLS